jgi:hypothetical protein
MKRITYNPTKERREFFMAGNSGKHRDGAVKGRSQFKGPNGNYIKRDTNTGRFMDQKTTGGKFKGVRTEK